MKKLLVFFIILMIMLTAGVCVHAASFDVESTSLPRAMVDEEYSAQINMVGGNDGYSFVFIGAYPDGLEMSSTGLITGIPTVSKRYSIINILISHIDGTSTLRRFSLVVDAKKMSVHITAPQVEYDGEEYEPIIECYDENGVLATELTPIVELGVNRLKKVSDAGSYYIYVTPPSGYKITRRTGDDYLVISSVSGASLNIDDIEVAYGEEYNPNVIVEPADAGFVVEYRKNGESEYTSEKPTTAGTYTMRAHTTNPNYDTVYAAATLKILGEIVNFTVSDNVKEYTGSALVPIITNNGGMTVNQDYVVTYTDAQGNLVEGEPINAGTYRVNINLINNEEYDIGTITPNRFTITPKTINFSVKFNNSDTTEYNGQIQIPDISTIPELDSYNNYTITYRKQGEENESVIQDVDVYDIIITFTNNNYVASETSDKTLIVNPKKIKFNVTNNNVTYNGKPQEAVISPTDANIPLSAYKVQYKKDNILSDTVTAAGVYEIIITPINNNYIIDENFNSSMVVLSVVRIIKGNSPVAIIYEDINHIEDTPENKQWKEEALESFRTNYRFVGEYIPNIPNVSTDVLSHIYYTPIGSYPQSVIDGDENTLIVKNISDAEMIAAKLDADPGIDVGGEIKTGTLSKVENIEGLYKITYVDEDKTYERYVVKIGNRIGDTNGNGSVNAIDANVLDKLDKIPEGVTEARIWDVNKDGFLNKNDADTIRSRFETKLIPYYPWIN